jgi:hypothetical protein
MPRTSPIKSNFNGGEWSPLAEGRVDLAKHPTALRVCLNSFGLVQGGWTRRPGTYYVAEVKDSSAKTRLVRFEFSTTQAYEIEFGNQYFRFYKDHAQIVTAGVGAWATATSYVVKDLVTSGGVTYYCIAAHASSDGGTPGVDDGAGDNEPGIGTDWPTYWYALTSGIYEVPSPYLTAILFEVKFTQSADVLYLTHPNYAPRKLSRTGHTAWVLQTIDFLDGPYLPTNVETTTLTLSGTTGSVTVTASAVTGINEDTGFQSTDVDRLIRWEDPAGEWTWLQITAVADTTHCTATIRGQDASAGTATANWRLGLWSDTTGYPAAVIFHDDRLCFGGGTYRPTRFDASKVGDYENFEPTLVDGSVADDNALSYSLNANEVNVIRWMNDDERGLIIGTAGGEWLVRPSTTSEALTPTNINAKRTSRNGSANVQGIGVGDATLYVQRAGRKLREIAYRFEADSLVSPDLTVLAEHITKGGLTEITFRQEPQSIVWGVRADGVLVGMTYEREQDVLGWHRHILGGAFGGGAAVVESVSSIPAPAGDRDETWLIVKRTINGATKRYVEYITPFFEQGDDLEDAFFVDCGLTYDGVAATTISGLSHLEAETVKILADGATHPDKTVTGGQITLDRATSVAQIGLAYNSDGQMLSLEGGSGAGTAQGKPKRIDSVMFRVYNTGALTYGPSFTELDTFSFRTSDDPTATAVPLYTGDLHVDFEGSYESDEFQETPDYISWRVNSPLPCTLLCIVPSYRVYDPS